MEEVKKPVSKPKAQPKMSEEEDKMLKEVKRHYSVLARDPNQDKVSIQEYVENKLKYIERVRERNLERAKAEMPNGLTVKQQAVYMEGASLYEDEIAILKSLLKKL